jgi:hypothetical protein
MLDPEIFEVRTGQIIRLSLSHLCISNRLAISCLTDNRKTNKIRFGKKTSPSGGALFMLVNYQYLKKVEICG